MAFSIVLEPSGREFIAAPGETLLESALRAGVSIKYNCNNGSCGQCQAQRLSGEIAITNHYDYTFSEQEKQQDNFLLCCSKPKSDLVIQVSEIGDVANIPQQNIETRVYRVDEASSNVRILQLRTPRSQTMQFMAGQHVTLEIDGFAPRNKSIASCPCNGMYLHFHIRNIADDPFAEYVFNQIKPKQKIMVSGPHGKFVLDELSERPLIFIANDTGFAPIKSLIEHAMALETNQAIHLYWLTDDEEKHYLSNYCRSWVDAFDNFSYTPVTIQNNDEQDSSAHELIQVAKKITVDYPNLDEFDVYLNGPATRYAEMSALLMQHGLPRDRLFIDSVKRY